MFNLWNMEIIKIKFLLCSAGSQDQIEHIR